MANELIISGTERPNLQTPEQHLFLARFANAVERTPGDRIEISSKLAPTLAERNALERRRGELVDGCRSPPASRQSAAVLLDRVIAMFDAWPTVRMDAEKAAGVARTYAELLEHLPLWAVDDGIRACKAKNTPFPPAAGELKAACEAKVQPFRDEAAVIRKVLEARPYEPQSDEARGRVKAEFGALVDDLHITNGDQPVRRAIDYRDHPVEAAQRALAEVTYDAPVEVSDELRQKLQETRS